MGAVGPGMAMQGIGAGVSAYGAYQQGVAQQHYYDYLASRTDVEADLTRKQGEQADTMAQQEGGYQTTTLRRKVSEVAGAQTAAAGANVGGGSATSADIAMDTFNKAKLDELAIKYNADLKSWSAKNNAAMQVWDLGEKAKGYRFAGKEANRAGRLSAIASLLGGSGQVANTWASGQQMGGV